MTLTLDIPSLGQAEQIPALTPALGAALAEAASVCLSQRISAYEAPLQVRGSFNKTFLLRWAMITEQMKRSHNDLTEATERGASAIAILLVRAITGLTIIERSRKGTGFDYWLGSDQMLFQRKQRLEVSGILDGDDFDIARRLRIKTTQTQRSDGLRIPCHIVVVDFGRPIAHYELRAFQ